MPEPDQSPHEAEVEAIARDIGNNVVSTIKLRIDRYMEANHITITDKDELMLLREFGGIVVDDLYDEDLDDTITELLKESQTDYAVPG